MVGRQCRGNTQQRWGWWSAKGHWLSAIVHGQGDWWCCRFGYGCDWIDHKCCFWSIGCRIWCDKGTCWWRCRPCFVCIQRIDWWRRKWTTTAGTTAKSSWTTAAIHSAESEVWRLVLSIGERAKWHHWWGIDCIWHSGERTVPTGRWRNWQLHHIGWHLQQDPVLRIHQGWRCRWSVWEHSGWHIGQVRWWAEQAANIDPSSAVDGVDHIGKEPGREHIHNVLCPHWRVQLDIVLHRWGW